MEDGWRTVSALLTGVASERPDSPALLAPDSSSLHFVDLVDRVDRLGWRLAEAGIGPGDRVAILLPNGTALAVALLAACSYAVAAPLPSNSPPAELRQAYHTLGVRCVLTTAGHPGADVARASHRAVVEVDPEYILDGRGARCAPPGTGTGPDDVVLVLRTSGTTGKAKVVPLRNRHLMTSAGTVARSLNLTESDRCLNVMPLFHVHGFVAGLLAQLAVGGSVICPPGLHPRQFPAWLRRTGPTWYTAVPTLHDAVIRRVGGGMPDTGLRFIRSASAPLAPALAASLEACFQVPVVEAYGMTEAAHQIASNPLPPGERKPRSVGLPTGCDVAILDSDGAHGEPGSVGEVVVRGPALFDGYEGARDASAFHSGWFMTGDRGYLDQDGYLFLTGRSKEMINRGGETIAPREVDEVLLAHPAVAQAVAFALPDERLGETVAAAVVPVSGATIEAGELRAFAATRLPVSAVPDRIVTLDQLPTGPTGKLQRIGLADRLASLLEADGGPAGATVRPPVTQAEQLVAAVWAQVLEVDRVHLDVRFTDLGGDSMLAELVVAELRRVFATPLPPGPLLAAPTVAEQVAAISAIVGDAGTTGRDGR